MAMQKNAQRLDDGWMDRCAAHYCMQLSPDMKTAVRNSVHAPKMCDLSFSHGLYVQGAGHAQQRTANLSRQCNVPAVCAPSTHIMWWCCCGVENRRNEGTKIQGSFYLHHSERAGQKMQYLQRKPFNIISI